MHELGDNECAACVRNRYATALQAIIAITQKKRMGHVVDTMAEEIHALAQGALRKP